MILRLGPIFCFLLVLGCGKETTQRNTIIASADTAQRGTMAGQLVIAEGAPTSSVSGATVTVQDHPELVTKTKSDGSFQIENVPAGTLNVIVTSAGPTGLAAAEYGVKIDAVKVKPQEKTDLGKQQLKKTGRLTGLVTFFDNPNNLDLAGCDVYVPGTDFIAKTDSQGSFLLEGLPEGTYTLKMQHTGFSTTTLEEVTLTSGQLTDLGAVPLSLALGPEGGITLQSDTTASIGGKDRKIRKSRTLSVTLNYDGDAALMKVSADPTFLNTTWKPVKKDLEWTFDSDGEKTLYVTFSDLNGLESSPFADTVFIDTEVPKIAEVKIMEGWAQTATTAIYLDVSGSDTGSGIQDVMLSNDANFTGATWQSFAGRLSWTVSSGDGPKTVYVKARDYAGRESVTASDSINKGTSTLIHNTTYASKVILYKEQSPYLVIDNITFDGEVEIKPGSTLYIQKEKTVTIKGVFTSEGTATDEILISVKDPASGNCGAMGITGYNMDFSQTLPGKSVATSVKYTHFQLASQLSFNGGTITLSKFDSSLCTADGMGKIVKYGMDNLLVTGNVFTEWKKGLEVQTGIANTIFSSNTGSMLGGFSQLGEATGTIIKDNSISWIPYYDAVYTPGLGTFTLANNSWTGTPSVGWYFSAAGNYTVNNLEISNAETLVRAGGSGNITVTINGGTVTSCTTLFLVSNTAQIVASNLNVSGCSKIVAHEAYSTATATINASSLSVTTRLVEAGSYSTPTTTLSGNMIACSTGSGTCDLYYKDASNGSVNTLTMSNNTIQCSLANNCRGFTFQQLYSNNVSEDFNLTLSSNTFVGKALNASLATNIIHTSDATLNDAELKIFTISPGPANGSDITIGGTISQ